MVQFYYLLYRNAYSGTSQYTLKGLKSVHYTAQSNSEENIRFGSIYSTRLEIEVYYTDHPKIAVGEIIKLGASRNFNSSFEEQSYANTYYIADYEVYEVKAESRNTYKVIAYDGIKRLDADYSARLRELNDSGSFPMTLADLLTDVATVAGLTISITGFGNYPPESLPVSSFYSDNLTCRDIMSWYVEMVGGLLIFGTFDNNMIFVTEYNTGGNAAGYLPRWNYIICPTDQTTYYDDNDNELIPVFYKQDGLKDFNTVVQPVDQAVIVKSDGTLFARYPYTVNNPTNIYYLSGNPLVELLQNTGNGNDSYIANRLYQSVIRTFSMIGTYPYKTAEITLFPFRFPFDQFSIVTVEDINGNRWKMPIMNVDVTDEEVRITSYGNATYDSSTGAYNTDQKTTSLDIRVNNIDSDKVSKSGDTMTGNLTIEEDYGGQVSIKNDDLTVGTTPSSNTSTGYFRLIDSAENLMSWFSGLFTGGRQVQTRMGARNKNENEGNANVDNQLILSVTRAGVRGVTVSEATPWRNALELGTDGAFPLTVAQGGTGGTTRATALNSLGIIGFQISAGQSQTINFSGNGCFVFGARADTSFCAAVDYWGSSVNVLPIGSGGAGVTITKSANAHSITITNTRSSLAIIGAVIPATTV